MTNYPIPTSPPPPPPSVARTASGPALCTSPEDFLAVASAAVTPGRALADQVFHFLLNSRRVVVVVVVVTTFLTVTATAGCCIVGSVPDTGFLRIVVKRQFLPRRDIPHGEEGEFVDAEIGVVDHDGEDPAVGVAGVVDEARGPAVAFTVDLVDGLGLELWCSFEEVEAEHVARSVGVGVREGLFAEPFALDQRFGRDHFADVGIDELAAGDGPGRTEPEAAMRCHEYVEREGAAELDYAVCAGGGRAGTKWVAFLNLHDFAGVSFPVEK